MPRKVEDQKCTCAGRMALQENLLGRMTPSALLLLQVGEFGVVSLSSLLQLSLSEAWLRIYMFWLPNRDLSHSSFTPELCTGDKNCKATETAKRHEETMNNMRVTIKHIGKNMPHLN